MGIAKVQPSQALALSKQKCLEVLNVLVDLCEKHEITYWLDGGTLLGAIRHGGMIPWDDDIDVCFPAKDYAKILDVLLAYSKEDNPYTIFFHGSEFQFCYDYFGDASVLVDGIYPARVDIICVKYVKDTPEAIAIDKSWVNVAAMYFLGKAKHPEDILEEHFHFLPKGKNLIEENNRFFDAYYTYMQESMQIENYDGRKLAYYYMNDLLVKRDRPHHRYEWIFPLGEVTFENRVFLAPNNQDAYLKNLYGEKYMELPPENQRKTHMNFVAKSDVDKWEWKLFLNDFYKSGFYNFVVTSKNKKIARPLMKIKTFTSLFFRQLIKGNFSMIKGLLWYSLFKLKRK